MMFNKQRKNDAELAKQMLRYHNMNPFFKKLLGTEKTVNGDDIISFRRYYLFLGILYIIMAVGSGIIGFFSEKTAESHSLLNVFAIILFSVILFFVNTFVIIVHALHDKEDEMYKETKSKINSTFLSVLSGMVYAAAIVTGAFHSFTISLEGWSIFVLMFAMLALHSFIGYYYERKLGSFNGEEDE